MRIAIISDIHSNLEALEAVMTDISKENIDQIFCLGDIIGYCASPIECLNIVKDKCSKIIVGNHDHAAIGLTNKDYFNINAKNAIQWTMELLNKEDINFLKSLPFQDSYNNKVLVHGSLYNPSDWGYILDEFEALASFHLMKNISICFIGHSHVPIGFEKDKKGVKFLGYLSKLKFEENKKYILNVGSVGQPRDGISDSSYGILDEENKYFEIKRISYDIETTKNKILKAGLPKFLAERIQHGR